MTTCIACIGSCDGAQDQENASMSPDPFPLQRVGSGNETSCILALTYRSGYRSSPNALYGHGHSNIIPFHSKTPAERCDHR